MKYFFAIILSIFLITGCSNKENQIKDDSVVVKILDEEFNLKSSSSLNNMYFKENYVDFTCDTVGKRHTIQYIKNENVVFEIRIMYDDTHSFEENKKALGHPEESKTINDIKYSYFNYKANEYETIHTYMYEYNKLTYVIMFISSNDISDLENKFMDNVIFREMR